MFYKMTNDELVAWGRAETEARKADLRNLDSAETLQRAKNNAKKRRLAVGFSAGQAFSAMGMAKAAQ